jgi:stage II sporulation protein D
VVERSRAAHGDVAVGVRGDEGGRIVRVALQTTARPVALTATGEWRIYESDGVNTLVHGLAGDVWTVQLTGRLLRAVRRDGVATAALPGPLLVQAMERGTLITVAGKRYRGEVAIYARPGGPLVVNRVSLEDYLRGVVPLEIGTRRVPAEFAAVAAQAVAARSYAYIRVTGDTTRPYEMVSTVTDQVYGGADAETPLADSAIAATEGEVLVFGGRVVNAPYSSTCGGSTAAATELWRRSTDEPYLLPVSDQVPGTGRYYCDESPRFRWARTFERGRLEAGLERHLRDYARVPSRGVGIVHDVQVDGRTPTDRVRTLTVITDRGRYTVRGNDIRFVLREPGGEILNSTYFSVERERGVDGALARVTLRGGGYGHGVGMCQWGAIGRARAGHDYRTILRTYYPGTSVATVD